MPPRDGFDGLKPGFTLVELMVALAIAGLVVLTAHRLFAAAGDAGRTFPGERIALADSIASLDFDYLLEPGAESRWVRVWVSPVSAPLAVRMRVERPGKGEGGRVVTDTLLFLIKERG